MRIDPKRAMSVQQALRSLGGFVRYYDSTEPLAALAAITAAGNYKNILACCGGGDQALTILGAGGGRAGLLAVDINPAQLFVLAAKAEHLKATGSLPAFVHIQKAYPGRVAAIKRNLSRLHQKCLCDRATGKVVPIPERLGEKFSLILSNEMFMLPQSGPYWRSDGNFSSRVIRALGNLRLARMDIFDCPDHFEPATVDFIYISDIYWQESLPYFQAQLARMAALLRPGGLIVNYLDSGDDQMGQAASPGRMLQQQAARLGLEAEPPAKNNGYLILRSTR